VILFQPNRPIAEIQSRTQNPLEGTIVLDQLSPRFLDAPEGDAYWFLNNLEILKATSASTGGAYSLLYQVSPSGHATPYHLHHDEDEAFYVLDGEFTFICDGKKTVVGPGGYIFLPRKIPHGIRCSGKTPGTMLILAMPGTGFVGMMIEMAMPATERVLPVPAPPDLDKLTALCEKYKIDILGPLPD
jgi:quercetin dioxygenase-like cupin family protein